MLQVIVILAVALLFLPLADLLYGPEFPVMTRVLKCVALIITLIWLVIFFVRS